MTLTEFDLRLAAHLRCGSATEMKLRMPNREYLAWKIKDARWPIGEKREDFRFALLTAAIHNAFGGNVQVTEFLPPEAREMSDEQIKAAAIAAAARSRQHGGETPQS